MAEGGYTDKHFVDKHQAELIQSVSNIAPILDELLYNKVIQQESYDKIRVLPSSPEKMRALFSGPLESSGVQGKEIFYNILNINEPRLIYYLRRREEEMFRRMSFQTGLSPISSGTKGKQQPSLIQRVETMVSLIELLLETLACLSGSEIKNFPSSYSRNRVMWSMMRDMQDAVFDMVQSQGQRSVERIENALNAIGRTDLVQRLSGSSFEPKKKHSLDEHLPALIHKVATMAAVRELLRETFSGLTVKELKDFRWFLQFTLFQRSIPQIPFVQPLADESEQVSLIVDMCGQQSVEVTMEVFMDMNRTDLVQRLKPETSARPKEKHSLDEKWPELNQEVEKLVSVTELLFETLAGLSDRELKQFKRILLHQTGFHKHRTSPQVPLWKMDSQDTVFLLVQTCHHQQPVETIKNVLKKMGRADLLQRLSHHSSQHKKEQSSDEHRSALIQRTATIAAVKQLLWETLKDLNKKEFRKFKKFLRLIVSQNNLRDIFGKPSPTADTVDLIVQTYGQKSVELFREVFMIMNRTDLVQRLPTPDKRSLIEHGPALFEIMPAVEAVEKILLQSLDYLTVKDLDKFKGLLQFTYFQKSLPQIPWSRLNMTNRVKLVGLMMENYGHQSVEVTREVFMDMGINRSAPAQTMLEASTVLRVKLQPELLQKEKLLEILEGLSSGDLEKFKHVLQYSKMKEGLPRIQGHQIEMAGRVQVVELMMALYSQQAIEVMMDVFKRMNRRDLVQRLSDISTEFKGPSRRLELGGTVQESSDWTKLEPEVNSTDADETPTYSIQSEAGHFECSVSGLRWVCKDKVHFKYQFCSWGEPMERMEIIRYMPAGPLIDIGVIAGQFDEVYLPHWICIGDNRKISDRFAVLHINECGDVVEKVSQVTTSHVKLSEPIFSPRAVLMKVGLPVKISCNVLIYYKPNTSFLKLHVYLIPLDPALQQTVDKMESSEGYKIIRKPRPNKYLKMQQGFNLTANLDTAKICPEKITLRYDSQDPNFYEVFIENPDRNFLLTLSHVNKDKTCGEPVWIREIRKDDYRNSPLEDVKSSSSIQHVVFPFSSETEDLCELMQAATITTDKERLLKVLEHLKQTEVREFKWFLQDKDTLADLPGIPSSRLEQGDLLDLVDLLLQTYSQECVEVTKRAFKKINRNDLVQML